MIDPGVIFECLAPAESAAFSNAVTSFCNSPHVFVQCTALWTLVRFFMQAEVNPVSEKLTPQDVVSFLITRAERPEPQLRESAVSALGFLLENSAPEKLTPFFGKVVAALGGMVKTFPEKSLRYLTSTIQVVIMKTEPDAIAPVKTELGGVVKNVLARLAELAAVKNVGNPPEVGLVNVLETVCENAELDLETNPVIFESVRRFLAEYAKTYPVFFCVA